MKYTHFYLYVFCCFFIGCAPYQPILSYSSDVSKNQKLWHGYGYGQIYELKHDMFLESDQQHILIIAAPHELTKGVCTLVYNVPPTIEEYNKLYNNWPEVISIVKKGTRIQCVRLQKGSAVILFDIVSVFYIYAKILDGTFAGHEVEISDLSLVECVDGEFLHKPNPNLIHLLDNNP